MIKAIFFDVGGTLRITHPGEPLNTGKIDELMSFIGEKGDREEFIARIHRGEKTYRRWCKPNHVELNEADLWTKFLLPEYPVNFIRSNAVRLNQYWRDSRRKYILPDVADTMRVLSQRGYKLGIISNTTSSIEAPQLLEETGLTSLFCSVILSAVFGKRKPHPSLFIEAARQAGVRPDECAYIGDRPSRDLIGARQSNFGKVVIINTEGYITDEYDPDDYDPEKDAHLLIKPDHFIKRLGELLDIFPEMAGGHGKSLDLKPFVLYDAALSTMWHVDQAEGFNAAFEQAKEVGFARFELNHQVTSQHIRQWDLTHSYISSVHDPCPAPYSYSEIKERDLVVSSLEENHRRESLDQVKRTIDFAVSLGAKSVVLHTGTITCDRSRDRALRDLFRQGKRGLVEFTVLREEMKAHREQFAAAHLEAVKRSLLEIIAHARGSGIALAVENRYQYYDIPLPEEMDELLGLCDESWFGFQLDTGHAHALETLGLCEKDAWLKKFSQRMIGVHLHDVWGLKDHQLPGSGDVDFRNIAGYLPSGCLRTLEINPRVTPAELKQGLEYLVNCGCVTTF